MSMPKGHKSENGYSTTKSLGGMTYHQIADEMNERGFKMNHSTARNVFVSSLNKVATNLASLYEVKLDEKELYRLSTDPRFQEAVVEFMKEMETWNESTEL